MDPPEKVPFVPRSYQEVLVEGFNKYLERIREIAAACLLASGLRLTVERMMQFVILAILQFTFGLVLGEAYTIYSSPAAGEVRVYIKSLAGKFPGRSTAHVRVGQVIAACRDAVIALAGDLQDFLYTTVGCRVRESARALIVEGRSRITAPAECFVGVVAPSVALLGLDVLARGKAIPFLNALLFGRSRRVTSVAELVGLLKTPTIEGGAAFFDLAGRLGFHGGPPRGNAFYEAFRWIEALLPHLDEVVNLELARLGVHDLTFTSVDSTNVPVDKRDSTGSVGTGSKGTFFGHKATISAGANCLPVSKDVAGGRVADSTRFGAAFQPAVDLARQSGQEMWATGADAGFCTEDIVDEIEAIGAVPFVDLNPRKSSLLNRLKRAADALVALSRKAFKAGLSIDERKAWLAEVQALSEQRGGVVPLAEKKRALVLVLRKLAARALRRGLSNGERRTERRLRKELTKVRREISARGTPSERRLGLLQVAHGTVEWLLVYGLRGQNEGINGILKKRGDLIGDGQHAAWIVGSSAVSCRIGADFVGIHVAALVYFQMMGAKSHPMRAVHNWRRKRMTFLFVVILLRFCR